MTESGTTDTTQPLATNSSLATALEQQLTRGNIFGFFVTLQICQLTQPSGSLLFRGVEGSLWRTNPVASFIEACIILRHLAGPAWNICKTLPGSLRSTNQKCRNDGLRKGLASFSLPGGNTFAIRQVLCYCFGGAMSDGADAELMQKLMNESFELEQPQGFATSAALTSPDVNSNAPPATRQEEEGTTAALASTSRPFPTSPPSQSINSHPPSLQRRWTELEAGRSLPSEPIASSSDPNSERAKLLHRAFGSNALAHGEKQIDLVTTAATLLTLVKLLVIHQAPWFTTYALLTISGWGAVQLLLVLFHSREMSDVDMVASVRQARAISGDLIQSARTWRTMYLVLHLPILGYVSYLVVFRMHMPHGLQWLGAITQWVLMLITYVTFYLCLLTTGGLGILATARLLSLAAGAFLLIVRRRFSWREFSELGDGFVESLIFLFIAPFTAWAALGLLTYSLKFAAAENPKKDEPYVPLFKEHSALDLLVDPGFRYTVMTLFFLLILAFLGVVFSWLFLEHMAGAPAHHAPGQHFAMSVGNFLITAAVFAWYLVTYDANGSYKPGWLDWLG